jgi:hypothetical protein
MTHNIGVFLNNTNSETKYITNLNNYNKLKDNFDSIIIVDEYNYFSNKLFDDIKSIQSEINNHVYLKYNSNNNLTDFNIEKVLYAIKDRDFSQFKNITFISDNYIYLNKLEDYFDYINSRPIELCSYTDSTEGEYHCQLYLFSINTKCIEIFINFLTVEINNKNFMYEFPKIFKKNIPFLKIAHIQDNLNKNIFYNNELYEYYILNNILPIINISMLKDYRHNYNYTLYSNIPDNFDIDIYKTNEDLKNFSNDFLYKHFLEYGQFEFRKYSNNDNINFILPSYIRLKLEQNNLLYLFDVENDFNIYNYRKKYNDLKKLNEQSLIFHWIDFGKKEKRTYT